MEIFTSLITTLCMAGYTAFAVWRISRYRSVMGGALEAVCTVAGGCLLYYVIAPVLAWLIVEFLKIGVILGLAAGLIGALFD